MGLSSVQCRPHPGVNVLQLLMLLVSIRWDDEEIFISLVPSADESLFVSQALTAKTLSSPPPSHLSFSGHPHRPAGSLSRQRAELHRSRALHRAGGCVRAIPRSAGYHCKEDEDGEEWLASGDKRNSLDLGSVEVSGPILFDVQHCWLLLQCI